MKGKGYTFLLIGLVGILFLIMGINAVNHGNAIRELEDRVEHLEKKIEYQDSYMETVNASNTVRFDRLEVSLGFVQPPDPDYEWQPLANIEGAGVSDSVFESYREEMANYISDLQGQIDYLRRWAENEGFNGTLYDDPNLLEPPDFEGVDD